MILNTNHFFNSHSRENPPPPYSSKQTLLLFSSQEAFSHVSGGLIPPVPSTKLTEIWLLNIFFMVVGLL